MFNHDFFEIVIGDIETTFICFKDMFQTVGSFSIVEGFNGNQVKSNPVIQNIMFSWNGYRIALLGGRWNYWGNAGGFCWYLGNGVGYRFRHIGGRLVYIPTRDSATYTAAIEAWKQKMAA